MTSSARLQEEANVARAGLSSALEELKQSVTTTAITNGAMTFVRDGSTAVARAAVDRATANPLATMVIGAGLLLLLAGDKKVGSAVGSLVEKGTSAAKSAAESASSAAESVTDRVTASAADQAGEAQGMLAKGQHQASDMLAKGREQGQQALNQTQNLIEQGRGKFEQFAQEQPILVAALGVAFGAAVGACLPITRTEQQYLRDPTRKAAGKAGDVARKAADAVTDELAGQNVAHTVSEVVGAVSSTVTQNLDAPKRR
jgi:hypothetical protein